MPNLNAMSTTITLVPYDPAWPAAFAGLAHRIRGALGGAALAVHHVGSTAVAGLSAKPIIDIVLAVVDSAGEDAYVPALTGVGFRFHLREPQWFEHRLMKADDPPANLHVFSVGCAEIDRMLRFRDWLRTHVDDRLLYESTKRELSCRTWASTQDYADAKTDVVAAIMRRVSALRT